MAWLIWTPIVLMVLVFWAALRWPNEDTPPRESDAAPGCHPNDGLMDVEPEQRRP